MQAEFPVLVQKIVKRVQSFYPEHVMLAKQAYTSGRERPDHNLHCSIPIHNIKLKQQQAMGYFQRASDQLGRGAFVLGSGALSKSAKSTGRAGVRASAVALVRLGSTIERDGVDGQSAHPRPRMHCGQEWPLMRVPLWRTPEPIWKGPLGAAI